MRWCFAVISIALNIWSCNGPKGSDSISRASDRGCPRASQLFTPSYNHAWAWCVSGGNLVLYWTLLHWLSNVCFHVKDRHNVFLMWITFWKWFKSRRPLREKKKKKKKAKLFKRFQTFLRFFSIVLACNVACHKVTRSELVVHLLFFLMANVQMDKAIKAIVMLY